MINYMSIKYTPSLELLQKILQIKKNSLLDKNKIIIGLRCHSPNLVSFIDHLINIIVSFFDINIIIIASCSPQLYQCIKMNNISFEYLTYYSDDNGTHNCDNNLQYMYFQIMKRIIDLDFLFLIINTASEYYVKKININMFDKNDELNQNYKYDSNDVIQEIKNLDPNWYWNKILSVNKKRQRFFIENTIMPIGMKITNCLVITKKILVHFLNLVDKYEPDDFFYNPESVIGSYMMKYFPLYIYSYCLVYWDDNANQILNIHKKNVENNNINYLTIKRVDVNNGLLNYLHENYMTYELNKIINNN